VCAPKVGEARYAAISYWQQNRFWIRTSIEVVALDRCAATTVDLGPQADRVVRRFGDCLGGLFLTGFGPAVSIAEIRRTP
jgi:hypothetical protein